MGGSRIGSNALAAGSGLLSSLTVCDPEKGVSISSISFFLSALTHTDKALHALSPLSTEVFFLNFS
jgi:hypothetical protein